jgi:hypothetical protein
MWETRDGRGAGFAPVEGAWPRAHTGSGAEGRGGGRGAAAMPHLTLQEHARSQAAVVLEGFQDLQGAVV